MEQHETVSKMVEAGGGRREEGGGRREEEGDKNVSLGCSPDVKQQQHLQQL